jgi:hypothetical protein
VNPACEEAIGLAGDRAERDAPGWSGEAFDLLAAFARKAAAAGETFTSEQVRAYAAERGLPAPEDGRAWGSLFLRASRAKLIEHAGFDTSANPRRGDTPIKKWRAR